MNTYDTNKLISAIQSFADRLRNDDRSSIMFEADWDTLMESKAMLRQQQALLDGADVVIKELQGRLSEKIDEIEALKSKLNKYHLKEDLDRNLDLIYGKEFIK